MAYSIGYKKPPKDKQFQKGKSGNARGRPKGSNNFLKLLQQELEKPIVVAENGKRKTVSRMQAMVMRMVNGALQSDQKALLTVFEILRRTGRLEETDVEALLPEDFESILDSYVDQRQKVASSKVAKEKSKGT
jgi:hypothetical protein